MTTQATLAVSTPATSTVTCTVLNPGYMHLIAERPTNADIIRKMVSVHSSGKRYAPRVTFKNGEVRRLVIGELTEVSATQLRFKAMMANGNDLVHVTGTFTGDTSGHVQIEATLG